jgi:catechol 2,3-dioxygenase-like lactoylglutathione lyase family enzyme
LPVQVESLAPLLQVFDMPTSLAFYRDTLGFTVEEQSPPAGDRCDWVLLRLGPVVLMLNTAYEQHERPAVPDPTRVAAHNDTALFFGCSDPDETYALLRARGVAAEAPIVAPYGMKQLWLKDPDGYTLCLQRPER